MSTATQPATLPDLSPYRFAAGLLRDELRFHPSPAQRLSLAAAYRLDAERLRACAALAGLAPEYEAIAAWIEAAAVGAR